MEIRLLGQVELWRGDRRIAIPRSHQRCVLAALAMTPGTPVGIQTLVNRLWGEQPPQTARRSLYSHVSRLRSILTAGVGSPSIHLHRSDHGYVLTADPERVDIHRARRLVTRAYTPEQEEEHTLALLRQASEVWRGPPLANVQGEWASMVRQGLAQERLALLIDRFRLEVGLGGHTTAIGPLSELVADHPLVEPLVALLMLSLYRSGLQVEALDLYTRTRRRMVEEIGDQPGEELRRLHERMLRRDTALEAQRLLSAGTLRRPGDGRRA